MITKNGPRPDGDRSGPSESATAIDETRSAGYRRSRSRARAVTMADAEREIPRTPQDLRFYVFSIETLATEILPPEGRAILPDILRAWARCLEQHITEPDDVERVMVGVLREHWLLNRGAAA